MQISENVSLRSYNTFGIEANARYFAPFTTREELVAAMEDKRVKNAPHMILGGGE
jgi:UDP-N-acetylmuramate dehydrogenase